jgi:glyoxylate/hydroxypyruvate reductase
MQVVLLGGWDCAEHQVWLGALRSAAPQVGWLDAAQAAIDPGRVEVAVVANPPAGSLSAFTRLRLIQSLWAGVDRLLDDPQLPPGVPIARMVDPAMNEAMAQTALWATLALHRGFFAYAQRQREAVWRVHAQRRAAELRVSVLGRGQMGRMAAACIAQQGYPVAAWGLNERPADTLDSVQQHAGAQALLPLLARSDVVINLLPLTAATRGLLNTAFFAALPIGASIVNLARGAHLVDADLLAALQRGHLRHAVLDVFHTEPLPHDHPFWRHPRVTLLPHAAALTDPRSAAQVVAANLRALQDGHPLANLVNRANGY